MCKARLWTPQDRRFDREIKEALAIPHLGPSAMPRKAVALAIGRSEGWYSRILNPDEYDWLPDLIDLRRIATVTGNAEPLRVLARWWGEGHELAETSPFNLLADTVATDDAFTTRLSQDLADGRLDQGEAKRLLPLAAARLQQAQQALDALKQRTRRP
jgi:hypothetical protein